MKLNQKVIAAFFLLFLTGGSVLFAEEGQAIANPWSPPPVIETAVQSGEYQINVSLDPAMPMDQKSDVDSIRIEDEAGELLGYKTREDEGGDFKAQFLIDLRNSMLDRIKVIVHGVTMGDWSSTVSLVEARADLLSQESAPPAAA